MQTVFYLLRHAEADYSGPNKWQTKGWGADLAPLSDVGRQQTTALAGRVEIIAPDIMICSPTTRTMETAMHLLNHVRVPFRVEFDLHEWVPDLAFEWRGLGDVQRIGSEFDAKEGVHSVDGSERWESLDMMRDRMIRTLMRYRTYRKVLVVCHGMVMRSLTGQIAIKNAEIIEFQIPA